MKIVQKTAAKLGSAGGKWLKDLIDASIEKDRNYFDFMTNLRNLLTGEHWKNIKGVTKEQVRMVVNLSHAHVRTLVPTLFFQNPSVDCAPTAPQHSGKEQTWNGLLNNTIDRINFADEVKQVVLDAVTYPEGVLKDVCKRPENATAESGNQGPKVWLDEGAPVHVRISPSQLIVDYNCKDRNVDNARFIAIRYRKPFQEIKLHPIYGKNVERDLKSSIAPSISTGNLVGKTHEDFEDWENPERKVTTIANEEQVTIYEVWVHQLISVDGEIQLYRQMCVLMEGQDAPIRELATWDSVMGEGFNQFPVTQLILNPIPDRPPQSELGVWQGMQMALNWLISRITQLVENDRLLYAVDPSKIKNFTKFRQQFYSGRARELVEVTDMNNPINIIQPTFVGRDNYSLINLLQSYIQQVSGIGQNRRGGSGIRTATEASLVDEGTRIKTDEKVDVVSKFLIKVLNKTAMITRSLVKRSLGTGWVFRIGGDIGAVKWVNFTAEEIQWNPEIRIRVNSFRKQDSMQEMQKFAGLIQQAMALFQMYGPTIRVDILFQRMLESAGIFDASKIVGDQDKQTLLQTLELAGIISGVETPVTEEQNHPAHLQVIEQFKQSPFGQQLMANAPELADRLAQHEQEHMQWMQALQEKAQKIQMAANPFAVVGNSEATPQSAANQQTSGDRTAVQSVPGGNGELA